MGLDFRPRFHNPLRPALDGVSETAKDRAKVAVFAALTAAVVGAVDYSLGTTGTQLWIASLLCGGTALSVGGLALTVKEVLSVK